MERELKLSMAVPMSMRYGDSQKQKKNKQTQTKQRVLLIWLAITIVVFGTFIFQAGRNRSPQAAMLEDLPSASLIEGKTLNNSIDKMGKDSSSTLKLPVSINLDEEDESEPVGEAAENPEETATPPDGIDQAADGTVLPTQSQLNAYAENAPLTYYAQSGDSLGVLAVRFGVEMSDIRSTADFLPNQLIPEGQVLFIPNRLGETTPTQKVFPDSEVVNSPSAVGFDLESYVNQAGGFLSTYSELVYGYYSMSGLEIVDLIATEYSIHPRILLALLEHNGGWVYGTPQTPNAKAFPLGIMNMDKRGLYHQLVQAAGLLGTGYYGWREGHTVVLTFKDGQTLRLAAELNAGSVALMHFFANQNTMGDWFEQIYGENRFAHTYESMFEDPWRIASQFEPLITADVEQPELILPFAEGVKWVMTVGPHAAWGAVDVRAALDFSPPKAVPGCERNYSLVTASSAGLVVRSENGTVVVDMDGDGNEETGWVIVYLHIATEGRISVGTWLQPGDKVGHPSCEGGQSTGSHLHIVRKYNGEWVPADGPIPFVMSGWRAVMDPISLGGWLVKGEEIVKASLYGTATSQVSR